MSALTEDQINEFIKCVRALSRGDASGPMGMEAIAMALCGKYGPGEQSVADALYAVSGSIDELKETIESATEQMVEAIKCLQD